MKKLLITILLLGLTGCSQYQLIDNKLINIGGGDIADNLLLKVSKDRILSSKEIVIPEQILIATSTSKETIIPAETIVEYDYISTTEVPTENITVDEKIIQEDVSKRTENSQHFEIGNNEYQGKFYSGNTFYKDTDKWFFIKTATTTLEVWNLLTKETALEKIKLYFVKNVFATNYNANSTNGYIRNYAAGTFETIRNAASGETKNSDALWVDVAYRTATSQFGIWRGFIPINTSAIDDSATISAASFNGYVGAVYDDYGTAYGYASIVSATEPSGDALDLADYNNISDTELHDSGERKDFTGLGINQYHAWTFNATGLAAISKTGYTNLSGRTGFDITNNAPSTSINGDSGIYFTNSASANPPYLSVTYTTGGAAPSTDSDIIIFE